MNLVSRNLAFALAALALSACTSLTSYRDQAFTSKTDALRGIRYSLPLRQYDIEITRALEKCEAQDGTTKSPDVKLSMSAAVTARDVAGESFLLDYTALSGWTKTTSVAIETYDTGVLKSINASADDKSAEIISATVKTGFGLAAIAGGFPLPISNSSFEAMSNEQKASFLETTKPQMLVCTDTAKKALEEIARLKNRLKSETGRLGELTERITTLARRQPIYGLTRKEKENLSALLDQQDDLIATIGTLQGQLTKAQDKVRFTSVVYWPNTVTANEASFPMGSQALAKFSNLLEQVDQDQSENATENDCGRFLELRACLSSKLIASARLIPLSVSPADSAAEDRKVDSTTATGQEGIFIRPPAPGVLLICKSMLATCTDYNRDYLYRSNAELVPQLGQLQFLPFRNEAFRNNVIALALRPNGSIEKLEYKTMKAAGQVVANLGADVVGQWAGFAAARDKADKDEAAAKSKAELDALDHQINLLTRQQQLDALQAPRNDELISLQAEITMTETRTRLLEAQAGERRARDALASGGD